MSLAQFLTSRKSDSNSFNQTVERINSLFNSSVSLFEQKIKAIEEKIASLEQMVAVAPHENPIKKIQQNKSSTSQNIQSLRSSLMTELKEFLSRRPVVE